MWIFKNIKVTEILIELVFYILNYYITSLFEVNISKSSRDTKYDSITTKNLCV